PEQLALDQLGGNRSAVYLHERPARARGERMDGTGHELLPGSVLSRDEHARGGRRDLLDALNHLLHRAARPHDLVLRVHLGLEAYVLAREVEVLQGVARSEEHTSELQSRGHLVCRLLLEKKKKSNTNGEMRK